MSLSQHWPQHLMVKWWVHQEQKKRLAAFWYALSTCIPHTVHFFYAATLVGKGLEKRPPCKFLILKAFNISTGFS